MKRKKLLDSFVLAECFAVATGQSPSAVIMTGDPGFKNLEHLVDIEWLDG